ncbi:MAG: hypothetical protein QOI04_167 [Verrucomicrobiota bacterium]|jgi:hypothetical protein
MAIHLNLLHEEIQEQRQRQRDPLKLGMMALGGIGAIMLLYYLWNAYQTLEIKSHLTMVQRNWAKEEPKVTAAQKRSQELTGIINTTKILDGMIEGRFYWAPLLEKIARCVAPNTQLTALEGAVLDENKGIGLTIEGVATGREPRAAAEDLRQLLMEQLAASYHDVKVEFKTLEDLDTLANLGGANMPMARYTLTVSFNPNGTSTSASPAPARGARK